MKYDNGNGYSEDSKEIKISMDHVARNMDKNFKNDSQENVKR